MDKDYRSDRGKIKYPTRITNGEVDAAMTHWCSKIIVPVCTMKGVAAWELEETSPGYAWQGETTFGVGVACHPAHVLVWHLGVDAVAAYWRGSG